MEGAIYKGWLIKSPPEKKMSGPRRIFPSVSQLFSSGEQQVLPSPVQLLALKLPTSPSLLLLSVLDRCDQVMSF